MNEIRNHYFSVSQQSTHTSLESFGTEFARWQRGANWWIGDLARYAETRWPDTWHQVFPEWISPGLVDRCKGVAKAYPLEADRNPLATWHVHMQNAGFTDRIQRVQAIVDKGLTSDQARQEATAERTDSAKARYLLAFDVHYFAHRFYFSGAGVETAMQVSEWIQRTVARLAEKGATDAVCAFEGGHSFRKDLTTGAEWDGQRYKDRPGKPDDLKQQLQLVRELLHGAGLCCVSVDRYEADDVLASYAHQFQGNVTIVSADKDMWQAMNDHVNVLRDVTWVVDETSGELMPEYQWYTAQLLKTGKGLTPKQHLEYSILCGDACDGVKGVIGIGEKGATDLIKQFESVDGAIAAAAAGDESIKEKKREALLEFRAKLEVTRQLVTLVTTLELPQNTRISHEMR